MSFLFKKQNRQAAESGFTLVELMVSMTIFTVLVTVGIGAVLNATNQHFVTSNVRSIMDSMNYVLEDMARNMRTGTEFRCVISSPSNDVAYPGYIVSSTTSTTSDVIPASCAGVSSNKIIFKTNSGANITYYIAPSTYSASPNTILKLSGDPSATNTPQVITPPEVVIDFAKSGFTVRGAEAGDHLQPVVIIRLSGTVMYKNIPSTFSIQTTVASRQLDS